MEDHKQIPLTQGQFAKVSPEDYEAVSRWKWFAYWNSHTKSYYAHRSIIRENGKGGNVSMHRQILGLEYGDKRHGDHANRDTLDNRRSNLRIATPSQNQGNSKVRICNSSGFKGVSWHKLMRRWRAEIRINRKTTVLGYFSSPEEAHAAYCAKAADAYGEFARTK
jgi:hypothetical protein